MPFRPISALILLPSIVILFELGRRFHARRKVAATSAAVEGAVFGLFGLLLAFTFSGAMTRYDAHRTLVIEETNDIGTAYLRLDLLAPGSQPALRQLFRDYTTSRLHLFNTVGSAISPNSIRLQRLIWEQAVRASAAPGASPDAAKLLLPAINAMIDITSTRQTAFHLHPPSIVFLLLFGLSFVCAFMAGSGTSSTGPNWYYAFALAITVTLTIYATLEIENPDRGLIRLTQTDQSLVDLRNSMQ
jgi:hypothetical protein